MMVKFTNQQRLEIIKNYYRNSESVVATLRTLTPIFDRDNRPSRQALRAIVDFAKKANSCLFYHVNIKHSSTLHYMPIENY